MSAGLTVELERLVAEAALCRGQLEELGQLVASYRQRVRDGLAQIGVTHDGGEQSPVDGGPAESLMPPALPEVVQSLAPELEIEELPAPAVADIPSAGPDPVSGWGPGGA